MNVKTLVCGAGALVVVLAGCAPGAPGTQGGASADADRAAQPKRIVLGAREAARSTRIAQEKIDELMKLDFSSDPEVAVGGNLAANETNHWDTPQDSDGNTVDGVTVRWAVDDGPVPDTRILTVRVENLRAQQYGRQVELSTIIRQW